MFLRIRTVCPTCQGAGEIIRNPCRPCSGTGRTRVKEKLAVKVPAGIHEGLRIRLHGKGDDGDAGAPSGNLYVQVAVEEHEFFRRENNDILCTIPISFSRACLGGTLDVPTVDDTNEPRAQARRARARRPVRAGGRGRAEVAEPPRRGARARARRVAG